MSNLEKLNKLKAEELDFIKADRRGAYNVLDMHNDFIRRSNDRVNKMLEEGHSGDKKMRQLLEDRQEANLRMKKRSIEREVEIDTNYREKTKQIEEKYKKLEEQEKEKNTETEKKEQK